MIIKSQKNKNLMISSTIVRIMYCFVLLIAYPVSGNASFCSSLGDPITLVNCEDFSGDNPLSAYNIINVTTGGVSAWNSISIVNTELGNELVFSGNANTGFKYGFVAHKQAFQWKGTSYETSIRFDTALPNLRSAAHITWDAGTGTDITNIDRTYIRATLQLDLARIYLTWGIGGNVGSTSVPWPNPTTYNNHPIRLEIEEVPGLVRPKILSFKIYVDHSLAISVNEDSLGIDLSGLPEYMHPTFHSVSHTYAAVNEVFGNAVIRKKVNFSCVGFEPPLNNGPVTVKKNRALPFKALLFDKNGAPVTNVELGAATPVIQVMYDAGDIIPPTDVTEYALPAGKSTSGNQFWFADGKWQYNLMTTNYTSPGTYTVTMKSGNGYSIEPTCMGSFVIK